MLYFLLFIILCLAFIALPNSKINVQVIRIKRYFFPCLIFIFLILLVVFSKSSFNSAHKAFMLWVNNVVPSLFPFLIGIELIKRTNFLELIGKMLEPIMRPLFNIPGCGAFALAMGLSSGYPVGAKIVSSLREQKLCTKTEAERLLAFCNTSGPLFIVGSVGVSMFGNSRIGLMLLLTHFLAAITVGLLFKNYHKSNSPSHIIAQKSNSANKKAIFRLRNLGALMGESIKSSVNTLLLICGYIVFFAVLGEVFENTGILSYLKLFIERFLTVFDIPLVCSSGILKGILEVTSGVKELSSLNTITYIKLLSVIAFILGFGGFSVHMQTCSIIADTDISMKPYFLGKFLHGAFASIYSYLIMKYTNFFNWDVVETFSYSFSNTYPAAQSGNLFLVILTTLLIIGICLRLFNNQKQKE